MLRDDLADLIYKATRKAQKKSSLPRTDIPEVVIERPRRPEHGDYATSLPLKMIADVNRALKEADKPKLSPLEVARSIVHRLEDAPFIGQVDVAPPGFINITLSDAWLAQQVAEILAAGDQFGRVDVGQGRRVQVEYGSINPTGPLHVGAGRNLALGDTIANLLEAGGYQVQREYYVNDAGVQMDKLGESIYVRYCQALGHDCGDIPEGGYRGNYVADWARQIVADEADRYLQMPREEAVVALREIGLNRALDNIREDCARMGVEYDHWFSERTLYETGVFDHIMSLLRQGDHLYLADGAVWFNATALGGDKDEVIIKSNGQTGYFASDPAYHYNKFVQRGFDWVIDVWGADHQGHVPRMKAAMAALGLDPDRLTLLIYQMVTILESGEQVRLSKRAGTSVDLRDLLDDIGPDAIRFFLVARSPDSQMDLDLDLARQQSDENPVYYVQYGHARIASILRYAAEQGFSDEGADVSLLAHPAELALVRKMIELEEVIYTAVDRLEPHHLTHYAQDLASTFHSFYRDCRVVSSEPEDAEVSKARLRLVKAAKQVLARTLRLMGVSAPESM
ncbi:MAG: arginine--tRNA ligase [Anaerolineae bacterium]|nr:arginine--tRNA ligase [Anaerolineae bacterium]